MVVPNELEDAMTVTESNSKTATVPMRDIPVRRVDFEYPLDQMPKHFATDGDLVMSHIMAVLSAVFPDGEEFFVRSVRHYRDQIEDPTLKKQVAGFIGQESVHGREHREFNDRLAELGYPTKGIERFIDKSLRIRERILGPKSNLAATAALEHYTATLAETLLGDPEARAQIGDGEVRNLFCWHALEESEHKAVAFDVYQHVGGSNRLRVFTMNAITVGFLLVTIAATAVSLVMDPYVRRHPVKLARSLWRVRRSPFLKRSVVHRIRDYNRPDFHPDHHDSAELVTTWRAELFGDQGGQGGQGALAGRLPT